MPDTLVNRRLLTLIALAAPAFGAAAAAPSRRRSGGHAPAGAAAGLPGDMVLGSPKAPVTVVEYASTGCPVCARWATEVWPAFKAKHIDTGRVRFVYREMLVGDAVEESTAAAGFVLARCAGAAKYFSVIDALYRRQEAIFANTRPILQAIAKEAGLDEARFNACVGDEAAFKALNDRVAANSRHDNIHSTPTFIVNGRKLEPGYTPLADLNAAIAKG